jgi:urate oxidase
MADQVQLLKQKYGKDNIRLVKVIRDNHPIHQVVELTVCCLLEGDFETSYTKADNSMVVATDSIKNTVYVLAKTSPNVNCPERFGLEIGKHFLDTYAHVSGAHVNIIMHRWTRMNIEGKDHPHSFYRDSNETRRTDMVVTRQSVPGRSSYSATVTSGIKDLLVLKTTGSAFSKFYRDRFATLPDAEDRVLSTSVTCNYTFKPRALSELVSIPFCDVFKTVRDITIRRFANDFSISVQATLYDMCVEALRRIRELDVVSYELPNKHVFGVDLAKFGLKNSQSDMTVFMPFEQPNGLITAVVGRKQAKL